MKSYLLDIYLRFNRTLSIYSDWNKIKKVLAKLNKSLSKPFLKQCPLNTTHNIASQSYQRILQAKSHTVDLLSIQIDKHKIFDTES